VLIHLQKRIKSLARKLFFSFVGLWLFSVASPCVLAAAACPPGMFSSVGMQHETDTTAHADVFCSELTKYSCQLPDRNSPPEASIPTDFTIVPVLLAILPAIPEPQILFSMRHAVKEPAPVTFTPLHIPHTVLQV
jgi:hypothetical protein